MRDGMLMLIQMFSTMTDEIVIDVMATVNIHVGVRQSQLNVMFMSAGHG
jgi:hypothetical protein